MGEELTTKIRETVLTKLLTFEVGWFDQEQNTSGAICSKLSNDANVRLNAGEVLNGRSNASSSSNPLNSVDCLCYGLIVAWRLGMVMLAIQPLTILFYHLLKALLKRLSQKATNSQAESSKLRAEVVSNIQTITAFSSQSRFLTLQNRAQAGPQKENIRQSWIAGTILGAAVATLLILVHTGQAIADAGSTTTEIAKGAATAQSIFGLLDKVTEIEPGKPQGHQPNYLVGQVELHDIYFAYPARQDVMIFEGLSLKIEAKKSTALVGCSGSGKSTVINLIERFYDPLRGTVVIDGKDVRTYNLRTMRKHVALVSREPNLFEGTIKENIAYGASESVDESEVIGAARIANAHDFIVGLRDGYNTRCGDKGVQLSGGQKQGLAIAKPY
ncbi:hypothetical protein Syun_023937 [Stephania yunnanensis]|uniref:ABC transmembrane type-1 domain-containing protein n=1 Tax=Stephania yunnanensis TaxID=152371 RepID=A0AAP0I3L5_9MAGN